MQRQAAISTSLRSFASPIVGAMPVRRLCATRTRANLALIAMNAIWGTTFVPTKPMLDRVSPLTTASIRFAIALLILLPLVRRAGGHIPLGRGPAIMGLTGGFLLDVCQNSGLPFTSAANGSLIHGGPGDDHICGGEGEDLVDGGSGNDVVLGNQANNLLIGGSGADTMFGGQGDDEINAGSGDDYIRGDGGTDTCKGGIGRNTIEQCEG